MDTPGWVVSKRAATSKRGVVAAQHPLAAEAGARMLARGGNAVDAAVAAALAVGVAEPWLSGLGGGGFMLVRKADDGAVHGIDFGMVSPQRLDRARYAIVEGEDLDWFQWPKVAGDRNIKGYESICVPGAVAGLGLAAERFGRIPWPALVAPALAMAEAGMQVDWFASLTIAVEASGLEEFPATRAIFLPGGRPPVARERVSEQRLANGALARTLRRLAEAGPRDFYEGEIARLLRADLAAGGSAIAADDLASYQARIVAPARLDYRGVHLHAMPGLTGGPTYLAAMAMLAEADLADGRLGPEAFVTYAKAITEAYARRLSSFGHAGITNDPGCTSHVSVIDADGMMVALTNSLLSRFGSKVTLPATGIVMNNGMMWFDPRPGRPNAIAAGERPLANMCPIIATGRRGPGLAMGAAGGRQIVPALVQLTSFLFDFGMSLQEAFHVPRLDASTRKVLCDTRMQAGAVAALARSFEVARVEDTVYPVQFGVPNAVRHDGSEQCNCGMAHVTTPWPTAIAEDALT